jgi:hypothetical protein
MIAFPSWIGDKRELEHKWRLPLKRIAISNWLAELVLNAGASEKDVAAIPIAIDHDRFHVVNSIRRRAKRGWHAQSIRAYKRSALGLCVIKMQKHSS